MLRLSALCPNIRDNAPITIDLPAPVSPVITVNPESNVMWIESISA